MSDKHNCIRYQQRGGLTVVGKRVVSDGVTVDLNPPGRYDILLDSPRHVTFSSLQGGQARVAFGGGDYRQVTAAPGSFDLIPAATPLASTKSI